MHWWVHSPVRKGYTRRWRQFIIMVDATTMTAVPLMGQLYRGVHISRSNVQVTRGRPTPIVVKSTQRFRCVSCGMHLFSEIEAA